MAAPDPERKAPDVASCAEPEQAPAPPPDLTAETAVMAAPDPERKAPDVASCAEPEQAPAPPPDLTAEMAVMAAPNSGRLMHRAGRAWEPEQAPSSTLAPAPGPAAERAVTQEPGPGQETPGATPYMAPSQAHGNAPELASDLMPWIGAARRDLPWRRAVHGRRDPYAVWVSEIMLQQTQVATVIPYFERWLARFPDIARLAAAPVQDVLKAWEGLGYYARARNLHAAAQRVMADYGGSLPAEREALLSLPGIGRYTAGAILSLAFGQPEPVLDGNVRRVLCRVYDVAEDPRRPAVEEYLWARAREVVEAAPPGRPGDLNEALMELGALVCVPGVPDCPACPIAGHCLARARGTQAERPAGPRRVPASHYDAVAAVIQDSAGRYLLAQRPPDGLLGGLWEFPGERARFSPAGARPVADLALMLGDVVHRKLALRVIVEPEPFIRVPHAYTHFRITLHAFRCRLASPVDAARPHGYTAAVWVHPGDFPVYPLPVTDQKIAASLGLLTPEKHRRNALSPCAGHTPSPSPSGRGERQSPLPKQERESPLPKQERESPLPPGEG